MECAFAPQTINSSPHPPVAEENNEPHPSKCFKFSDENEMEELAKGIIPASTSRATKWAMKTFVQWCTARNNQHQLDIVLTDIATSSDHEVFNKYLSMFAVEARKTNGQNYPPATLHQLFKIHARYKPGTNPECPNFLNKKDRKFRKLQSTLDVHFHNLHSDGIGKQVKHAEVFTSEALGEWCS